MTNFSRGGVEKTDDIRMDLFQGDEFQVRGAEGGLEAVAVLEDVFLGVPVGEAQIKNFLAVLSADAAGLGAETVDEPCEFGKGGHLEDCEVAAFAFIPILIGSAGRDRRECPS